MNASIRTLRKAKSLVGFMAALVVVAGVVSTAPAQLGLQYTFDATTDDLAAAGGIHDQSGNGHNGTVIDASLAQFVLGPSGNMNAIHLNGVDVSGDQTQGSGINTGTPTDNPDVNIWLGPFTAMAWVNMDNQIADNMVFGTGEPPNEGQLHLGFRNDLVYFGFWGASVGRDSSVPAPFGTGEWHHVAYRFTGAGGPGSQDIFVDGVLSNSQTSPFYGDFLTESNTDNVVRTLLVGRLTATNRNEGAFAGSLSDVRIYNVALSDGDIAAIAGSPP